MSFNGSEGSPISVTAAAELTNNYQSLNPGQIKAGFIGKDYISELINQEGSMGIRIYFGTKDNGENTLVLVSALENEDDDLNLIIDNAEPCPMRCSSANALNPGK